MSSVKPRIRTLDSLRGFAALSVVLGHLTDRLLNPSLFKIPFLAILTAGHNAVIFFFLLSGYVLIYQYAFNPAYNYRRFLVQRLFRIYVPYIIAIAFAVILFLACTPNHTENIWLSQVWKTPINLETIVKHMILVGNFNTNAIIAPVWSLVHEMRISLIFPLLLLFIRLKPYQSLTAGLALFGIASVCIALNIEHAFGYFNSYSYTIYYLLMFIAGGVIAKNQTYLTGFYGRLTKFQKVTSIIIALLLYNYSRKIAIAFAIRYLPFYDNCANIINDLIVTTACSWIIIGAIYIAGQKNFLEKRAFLSLGKISYSLYLVHAPVAGFIYFTLHDKMPIKLILLLCLAASLLIAIVFNKYVEQTSVKVGRRLLSKYLNNKNPNGY